MLARLGAFTYTTAIFDERDQVVQSCWPGDDSDAINIFGAIFAATGLAIPYAVRWAGAQRSRQVAISNSSTGDLLAAPARAPGVKDRNEV